jgi:hypothetical protein
MKKFLIYLSILILAILIFLKFFFDPIAKSIILKRLSVDTGREVSLGKINTNFLKGSIQIKNIQIKNSPIFSRENLATISSIEGKLKLDMLTSGIINFSKISFENINLNYDVIVQNGKIVDSFYLLEGFLNKSPNNNSIVEKSKPTKQILPGNNELNKNRKSIDFVIDRLIIPKINISVLAKDLKFKKNIILDKMIFTNVGNTKNSNHFKDVISAITTNIAVKINNEVIVENIKQQFEKKINKLLGSEKLKSILGKDSEKVIQNLKKFFK